ncbi:MAG: 30S ribosomal protein S13 [Candidatus Micrarchaeota archaeon]
MEKQEIRYIVRILNKDLNGNLSIGHALMSIKGISHRTGKLMASVFEKNTGINPNTKIGEMPEEFDKKLEDIAGHPDKYGMPQWMMNRRNDFEDGKTWHATMSELDFALRKDLQRLNEIKSYRGLRLSWGLTVRGQKTKSTHRNKGGVVSVTKKVEAPTGKSQTPAKAAAKPAEKKK